MFFRMTNMTKIAKIIYESKNTSKSKVAANFGQKLYLSMKTTYMPSSIPP